MQDDISHYSDEFFRRQRDGSRRSASAVIPQVLDLIPVNSVVDVGCGIGTWLAVFHEHGVKDICGIDWHRSAEMLQIPAERYLSRDLTAPLGIDREFDLVVSLEVGEHLPPEAASTFVRSLSSLGKVVLFSAAIPYQGGTNHLNEQWPSYWVERFSECGFVMVDCIRGRVWDNPDVKWFYAQNIFMFVRADSLDKYPALRRERERQTSAPLAIAHPRGYLEFQQIRLAMEDICKTIPPEDGMILVDDGQLVDGQLAVRRAVRFMETWNGAVSFDEAVRIELDRLRTEGFKFMVFVWPSFWWFEHYKTFDRHLRSSFPVLLENERVAILDLRVQAGRND
jgi:SAM-dependent methyltransferase